MSQELSAGELETDPSKPAKTPVIAMRTASLSVCIRDHTLTLHELSDSKHCWFVRLEGQKVERPMNKI